MILVYRYNLYLIYTYLTGKMDRYTGIRAYIVSVYLYTSKPNLLHCPLRGALC